jgi:hypothetical protein
VQVTENNFNFNFITSPMNKSVEPAVIAYPVHSPSKYSSNSMMSNGDSHDSLMDDSVMYSSALGDAQFADDTVEMSGNFFSQVSRYHLLLLLNTAPHSW